MASTDGATYRRSSQDPALQFLALVDQAVRLDAPLPQGMRHAAPLVPGAVDQELTASGDPVDQAAELSVIGPLSAPRAAFPRSKPP